MDGNFEFLNLINTTLGVGILYPPCVSCRHTAGMLQARCSLSGCPVYVRHKYVNMDVNSAFLKLTNAMACVKIILNVN